LLQTNLSNFLQYCKNANFAQRSVESMTFRLNEFNQFIKSQNILSIWKLTINISWSSWLTITSLPSMSKKASVLCLRQLTKDNFDKCLVFCVHYQADKTVARNQSQMLTMSWSKNFFSKLTHFFDLGYFFPVLAGTFKDK